MSDYKGFITRAKLVQLTNLVKNIADTRGLENKLHHLYQPDTDMNDKVCENLQDSKISIVNDLIHIKQVIDFIIKQILTLN